jgi:hypothetical protein
VKLVKSNIVDIQWGKKKDKADSHINGYDDVANF